MASNNTTADALAWQADAACTVVDTSIFFPNDDAGPNRYERARRVCSDCPVRVECFNWARDNNLRHGMYGGRNMADSDQRKAGPINPPTRGRVAA